MIYELLVFCIVSGAITYVATESIIWAPVRIVLGVLFANMLQQRHPLLYSKLVTLMYCPMCSGFWIGIICYALGWGSWSSWPRGAFEAGCTGLLTGAALTNFISFNAYNAEVGKGDSNEPT